MDNGFPVKLYWRSQYGWMDGRIHSYMQRAHPAKREQYSICCIPPWDDIFPTILEIEGSIWHADQSSILWSLSSIAHNACLFPARSSADCPVSCSTHLSRTVCVISCLSRHTTFCFIPDSVLPACDVSWV